MTFGMALWMTLLTSIFWITFAVTKHDHLSAIAGLVIPVFVLIILAYWQFHIHSSKTALVIVWISFILLFSANLVMGVNGNTAIEVLTIMANVVIIPTAMYTTLKYVLKKA